MGVLACCVRRSCPVEITGKEKPTKSEVTGNIGDIRAIEDCIRASKKYTEGLGTLDRHHPAPSQGGEFPSVVFCKHYEVYPDVAEVSWDMPVGQALDWLSSARCVNIRFYYDYRKNTATLSLPSLENSLWEKLKEAVPGFHDAFKKARNAGQMQLVDQSSRRTAEVLRAD